jgi:hypothetical protein
MFLLGGLRSSRNQVADKTHHAPAHRAPQLITPPGLAALVTRCIRVGAQAATAAVTGVRQPLAEFIESRVRHLSAPSTFRAF